VLTVNGPVNDPGVTVTEAGTVSEGNPLPLSMTTTPAADAALDNVTVQLLLLLAPRAVGLHSSADTTVAVANVRLTTCEVLLYAAVSVPF
jgi:hypothetical protein